MTTKKGIREIPFRVFKMSAERLSAYVREREGKVEHTHTTHVYKHGDNISACIAVRNDQWLSELGFEFHESIHIKGVDKKPVSTMVF